MDAHDQRPTQQGPGAGRHLSCYELATTPASISLQDACRNFASTILEFAMKTNYLFDKTLKVVGSAAMAYLTIYLMAVLVMAI